MVIGSLPINLVAALCAMGAEYWHLSIHMPAQARGQELSAEDLVAYEAKLERYGAIRKEDEKKPR